MASSEVLVNGFSTENGFDATAGQTLTISLNDSAGANTWTLTCFSASEGWNIANILTTYSMNTSTKQATITVPSSAGTLLIRSQINGGYDVNGKQVKNYTSTFGIFVRNANNLRLAAPELTFEASKEYGWTTMMNESFNVGGGSGTVVSFGGDLSGSNTSQNVNKIKGVSVSATAPTTGQVLAFNGASWAPAAATSVSFAGDLSGDASTQVVEKINGAIVPFADDSLVTGNVLKVSDYNTLTYGAITLSNTNSVTGNLSINNIANGSENWILTGSSGSNPIWNNSIKSMLNVSSRQFDVVDAIYPTQSLARTQCYSVTTSNTTPSSVTSITLAASTGISLTVNATISDGYTTYGGTNRITNIIKTGLFYRGSSGGAVRSEYSTDTYIHSAVNALHAYEINFSVSGNNVVISRTGESRNSKWTITVSYNLVSL